MNAQDQMSDSTQPEKFTRPTESCSKGRETPKGKRRKVGGNAIKAIQGIIKLGPGQVSHRRRDLVFIVIGLVINFAKSTQLL